jgi:hypothetical protein
VALMGSNEVGVLEWGLLVSVKSRLIFFEGWVIGDLGHLKI